MLRQRLLFAASAVFCLLFITACSNNGNHGNNSNSTSRCNNNSNNNTSPIWSDEFNGSVNQSPDSTRWTFDFGTNWGNNQLEWDTNRPENASLDGQGNLRITARRESYRGQDYTSARMITRGLFEPTYGRFEARIKMPTGQGIWPAFWLLGANINTVGWPQCGEIDAMEFLGHEPNAIYGAIHGPGYSGAQGVSKKYTLPAGQRFDTDFHVFAVEWTPTTVIWYVNGTQYHQVTRADLTGPWVFDHPFYIILNVAVGGNWPRDPDASTVFPQTMLVDYVRVYANN